MLCPATELCLTIFHLNRSGPTLRSSLSPAVRMQRYSKLLWQQMAASRCSFYEHRTTKPVRIATRSRFRPLMASIPRRRSITVNLTDVNEAPTAVALANATASILENTSTASHIKVADINVTDDALGSNTWALTGADAASFEIVGSALYLKAGTVLDFESKTSYAVAVTVDDPTVGATPDATSTTYTLNVSNVPGVTITGTSAANTIDATHTVAGQPLPTNEEDTINAGGGNDTINALGGNDFINGGAGADTMFGGTGNDTYVVDNSGDMVNETGGNGLDTVQSSITFSLSDAVHAIGAIENLTLTGTAAINGTGNALDNVITGNSGNNMHGWAWWRGHSGRRCRYRYGDLCRIAGRR